MTTTSNYQIAVDVLTDTTQLTAGTTTAANAIDALAASVDTSSDQMRTSLASVDEGVTSSFGPSGTIPRTVEDGAVNLTTKASKFKAVGADLGSTLAQGIAGGVSSGDAVGAVSSSVSGAAGLLAVAAGTAGGAAAAVGLGIATSLVTGLISGMKAKDEAFQAEVTKIFDSMEITADSTMRAIRKTISDGFSFQSTVDSFGGEALADDAALFGSNLATAAALLNGKMTPAAKELHSVLQDVIDTEAPASDDFSYQAALLRAQQKAAGDLLSKLEENQAVRKEDLTLGRQGLQYERDTTGWVKEHANAFGVLIDSTSRVDDNMVTVATNSERAAAAAERYAAQLERAASAAAQIATKALNGIGL